MQSKKLPIKLEEIAHVYDYMAQQDGGYSHELDEYQPGQMATIFDITTLFFKLDEHYSSGVGQMSSIKEEDCKFLFDIFHTMSEYYVTGDGYNLDKTRQLSVLYGELADLYDPSVQVKENDHVDDHTKDYEEIMQMEKNL